MRQSHFYALLLMGISLVSACREDPIPAKQYEVPAIIQPYVDLFEQEAAARGQNLVIDDLIVSFAEDLQSSNGADAAGICRTDTSGRRQATPQIEFDTTSFNWRNNAYHRETLVFHELGHCILRRFSHRDDLLPNANIASIMRSTGEQVYGGLLNNFKRDYYLDELFDPSTSPPDWATDSPAYSEIGSKTAVFTDEFINNAKGWTLGTSANTTSSISGGFFLFESKTDEFAFVTFNDRVLRDLDSDRDFEIELAFRINTGDNLAMFQWAGSDKDDIFFWGFDPSSVVRVGNWTTGTATAREETAINTNALNKFTLRRKGNFYYLYVNETFFDILEFEPFFGKQFGFYIGPNTRMLVDYLHVSYLD